MLLNAVEKETSSIMELYYGVSGLVALSEKISAETIANIVKALQNMLQKDDDLWKYGLLC